MDREAFFTALWSDFVAIAPHAGKIHEAFAARGERVENDHVAFRTFDRGPVALERLEPLVLGLGYRADDEYHFEQKCLRARSYVSAGAPRIFLSELLVGKMPADVQATIDDCIGHLGPSAMASPSCFWSGRPWPPLTFARYEAISQVSEYAAWMCAHGFHANHFTVSVNALTTFESLSAVLDFVEHNGYRINESGGRIKGSPGVHLEQGSTLADRVSVEFADGPHLVPSCYYEFALRHPLPNGELYQGFVTDSADKIFESTHRQAS